ncbi:MAG: serine/threonine protein kinase [Acidobacteria bacterium]|jgi:serine/threonine-protein kinase|nr:serine/threonine protein kinase [Acidobacteriota bacterium]
MDTERWKKIKGLFDAAQELEPKKREKFLENACGNDVELRREIENLLNSFENAESFMEKPAAREVASMFEDKKTLAANRTTGDLQSEKFIAGTILANRYRIIGLLGRGGMGEVFKAEDIKLNQTVALKFLPDELEKDKAALVRFHSEVRNARQVSHPNVCRVFDISEIEGKHFLSMEFIDGDDLSSLLRRIGRLPSDKAVEIARQLCFGLAAIHDAGILHRDLKPANVIIDSKGKARITDFGIAGLESELKANAGVVGTPAYMSPEQIAGKELTTKSDIYSLGLVLYEIFTGKQAFQSDSIHELLKKQQTTAPTNPSEVLKEIDPIVEKTILQCLEKNPTERPKNALQVAMMLPGGNPLEAAIAAGETPSPEMVAAAPKKGALKPAVAVACLSAVVLLFAFIVFFSGRVKYHEWIPLEKSPEVLAERAASILKKLGYTNAPVDTDYGFGENVNDYYNYADAEQSLQRWERMRSGQPAIIYFWHRTSPRYLEPLQYEMVKPDDPSNDVAGMTKVILDARGRLLEFQAVPPQVKEKTAQTSEVDWSMLFSEAGLDIRNYRQTESNWTPPVYADSSLSWEGTHIDHAEIPVRIEAAAFQGKPVYFQIVAPWDKPARQEETAVTAPVKVAGVLLISLFIGVIIAGVFLARRNLQRGRSDVKGAFKITIFVFLMSLAASLLFADHVPDLAKEEPLLSKMAGTSLFNGALIGLIYLALEPYVRRRWASLIISWNRLLAGDFRDPMVGRDILVGGILGLAHTATIFMMYLLPTWMGEAVAPNPGMSVSYLQSFKHLLATFLSGTSSAMFFALCGLLFLVLLVTIFRKQWLAMFVFWAIYFLINGLFFASGGHWIFWLAPALIGVINVICIARFGLLATVSFFVFFFLTFHNPITANVSSWYFGNTIFAAVVILGLAIYGFYTSLAGQKIFEAKFLNEVER